MEDVEISCLLCNPKKTLLNNRQFNRMLGGKMNFVDRGRDQFIKKMGWMLDEDLGNTINRRVMVPIYRHWMRSHKNKIVRIHKRGGEPELWKQLKIKGKKRLESHGVKFEP